MTEQTIACPLCGGVSVRFLIADAKQYLRCGGCELRFLDPAARLSTAEEHGHYLHHENDVEDPRYRGFLARLADPLLEVLPSGRQGLDYGCGPGPALAAMLREAGHAMAIWDPYFEPDSEPLRRQYDFITCTEVIEHFHDPAAEFARFEAMLKPGGVLGLMTCFQTDDDRFEHWHYRKDPTHVAFYREETLHWVADKFGWKCTLPRKDVAIMFKHETVL